MNIYEEMQDRAYNAGMNVIGYTFRNKTIKGLYCDGTAAISNNIDTNAEKACVLAEEMGHHRSNRRTEPKTRVSCQNVGIQ